MGSWVGGAQPFTANHRSVPHRVDVKAHDARPLVLCSQVVLHRHLHVVVQEVVPVPRLDVAHWEAVGVDDGAVVVRGSGREVIQ